MVKNTDAAGLLAKNLKSILRIKNKSQLALADRLRVAPSTVSIWVAGKGSPSIHHVGRIARALKIDVADLFAV